MPGFRSDWSEISSRLLARLSKADIPGVRREDLADLEDLLAMGLQAMPALLESWQGLSGDTSQIKDSALVRWVQGAGEVRRRMGGIGPLVRALRGMERAVFQESA